MRVATALTLLASLAAAGCSSSPAPGTPEARGRADAEAAIADGDPCLLFFGLPAPDRDILDRETGLPQWSQGCCIDDEGAAYQEAFNDTMRRALANGRLASMTLAHKWMPWPQVEAALGSPDAVDLAYGDAAGSAGEGRWQVAVRPRDLDGSPGPTPYVYVRDGEGGTWTEITYLGAPRAHVAFAHDGTTLVVRDDAYDRIFTVHLPRALEMQYFRPEDRR